jgi:hypothetical protein
MRRIRHPWALAGWGLAVAAAIATCLVLAGHTPSRAAPASADDRVPEDLFWPWVASCGVDIRRPLVNVGYDGDGLVDISVGMLDPDAPYGTPLTDENDSAVVDEAASQAINSCLSAHRLAPSSRTYREATDADRLLLYDWTAGWQAPCLRGHGYDFDIPGVEQFFHPHEVWWFLLSTYDWTEDDDLDFEQMLDARLNCDPVPPFLAADGVYW